jgi:hypothetical protein
MQRQITRVFKAQVKNIIFCGVIGLSMSSEAAKLKSYCTLDETSLEVKGMNIEERLPIASVSKVFTSLFAVSQNNIEKKVYTQFYYSAVGNGLYDVHIQGSHEPYFNRSAFQWMVSKLNEAGVSNIRTLSFDENFKYYHETDKIYRVGKKIVNPVSGKDDIDAPSADLVKRQISQLTQRDELLKNYLKTYNEALQNGVELSKKINFSFQKIEIVKSDQFKPNSETKKGYIASPGLIRMLKLMNWNSNNHAANQFFQLSGGINKFNDFFYKTLGFKESDLKFINGSGQNAMIDGNGRLYNEANCSTVVRSVKGLKAALEAQKAKLEDVLAVMGGDIGSTVSGTAYNNKLTHLSVIAKTGTVGTNITLAGMISSRSGNHFFFFNVEQGSPRRKVRNLEAWRNQEANRSRQLISAKLQQIITTFGGPSPIEYKLKFFDLDSFEDSGDDKLIETAVPETTVSEKVNTIEN